MGHADVFVATDLAGGALWGATYLSILRRGARDRTSGVPLLALASAFAWELLFGVVRPTAKLPPFVVPVWLSLDACILYQFLRYRTAASTRRARALRCAGVLAAVLGALAIERALVVDLGDLDGVLVRLRRQRRHVGRVRRQARPPPGGGRAVEAIALAKLAGSAFTVPHAWRSMARWRRSVRSSR